MAVRTLEETERNQILKILSETRWRIEGKDGWRNVPRRGHRCRTPHFVAKISLTYKTEIPILPPTKRTFLSNSTCPEFTDSFRSAVAE